MREKLNFWRRYVRVYFLYCWKELNTIFEFTEYGVGFEIDDVMAI